MRNLIAIFLTVFGFSSVSQAKILVEPFFGYEASTMKATLLLTSPVTLDVPFTSTVSGAGYGLRLGYKFLMPWVALEYFGMSGKAKYTTSVDGITFEDEDVTRSALGVVGGIDIPMGMRIFAGYGFSNELSLKSSSGTEKFKGSYMKAGLGFSMIPLLSLNLEYIINKYTKYSSGGTEVDLDTVYRDASHNSLFFSVSIPLNL